MAVTIDWSNKIINIPRADLQLVQSTPVEVRQLDLNAFRLELKGIEDGEGMPYPDTHQHVAPISVGGVTLARVVEIINDYTITFEDGQYAVNLLGANSNVGDKVNVNQVSVRSANSAGLTFSEQINDQSYAGRVHIDPINGRAGGSFPLGTQTEPVNNLPDAMTIANARRLDTFRLTGVLATDDSIDVGSKTFYGSSRLSSVVSMTNTPVNLAAFNHIHLTGTQGPGFIVTEDCLIGTIVNAEGGFLNSVLNGTITLAASPSGPNDTSFFDCVSGFPGSQSLELDANGTTANIQFRRFSGKLLVSNLTGGNQMSFESPHGSLELDATCTNATVVVRGVVELVDNSGPGCTVIHEDVLDGGLSGTRIKEVWQKSGLDAANPVTATPSQITVDGVVITLTGDGVSTKTATRQP